MPTIHGLAEKAAGYIARELGIDGQKEGMLAFGLELLLGSTLEFALIMALACLFGIFRETLLLVLTAGILRLVSGGEHCRAYYRCLIGGAVFFLAMGWLVKWLNSIIAYQSMIFLMMISFTAVIFVIWKYAPGETENKPLTEADRVRGKKLSFLVTGIFAGIVILLLILNIDQAYMLSVVVGMLCQTFTLTPWGYRFIRCVDRILSFRDYRGDSSELESSDR
ncbi:MAG: Accessory gene regulator B [Thermoanaerobacterales bacterium 50_218]|nr:MAG: Accessory gene regulator B [Thermoanaerobacterales bacterium 50_218]HAA89048.1 accessory regulator AgrB [Peptococcaceae bacterium]